VVELGEHFLRFEGFFLTNNDAEYIPTSRLLTKKNWKSSAVHWSFTRKGGTIVGLVCGDASPAFYVQANSVSEPLFCHS